MEIKKVNEALRLVESSLEDADFLKWLEENDQSLSFHYDMYYQQCVEGFEEPEGFQIWALGRYLDGKTA